MEKERQEPNAEGKEAWSAGTARPSPGLQAPRLRISRLRGDDYVAALIILFCAVVVGFTTTFDAVPAALAQGIPPEQFPRLLSGVIAALAVVLIFQARKGEPKKRKPVPPMVYKSAALLVVYVAVIEWIGIIPAMILFCLSLPILWGERNYVILGIYAVSFSTAVYFLFSRALDVYFPMGELFSTLALPLLG
jgi:putative tricarboxylic transport membrane protein